MHNNRLLQRASLGTVFTALCCFTPLLVIVLPALGLAAWLSWLDYVLLPALAACIGITIYALFRTRQRSSKKDS